MTDPNDKRPAHSPAAQASACSLPSEAETSSNAEYVKSDREWREQLQPEQYRVLRQQGTEPAFRNALWDQKAPGIYLCAGCQAPLFASSCKYDSRTGWPSFFDTLEPDFVGSVVDRSHGMIRTETHCRRCGGHLGHVFEDGPAPSGLRYCINSASLEFVPKAKLDQRGLSSYADRAG